MLSFLEALPRYWGGKRRLLPAIMREIASEIDPREWKNCSFVDGFLGGASVALYAKAQFREVVGNDLAERSAIVAEALLCNDSVRLTETDCRLLLAGAEAPNGWCAGQPDWFIPATAAFVDRGIAYANGVPNPTRRALLKLLVWRIISGSLPMGGQATSPRIGERLLSGELKNNVAMDCRFALRSPDMRDLRRFSTRINKGVFGGKFSFTRLDAVVASESWGADVVYLDPPYAGDSSYSWFYKTADSALEQRDVDTDFDTPFNDPNRAMEMLAAIAENSYKAGARVVVYSNSDEKVGREAHAAVFAPFFDVREAQVVHRHSGAGRTPAGDRSRTSGASEVLLICRRR